MMTKAQDLKPGKLVKARGREWIVLPSADNEVLNLKPLGGSIEEATSIYLPFQFGNETIDEVYFEDPSSDHIGDFDSARVLYDAIRLSFREAAGPFRSIGKLNFTPRAYQMVPLIMALKQSEPVRLFIADDVGIGKTVESLMIVRELLDRGVIKKFAIICLPHLCEQWAQELRDKFSIEAAIFTSGNAARLTKNIPIHLDPLDYYPYQILSIDYIKADNKAAQFIQGCPEMVIVDEIHTCADDNSSKKQLRHKLISKIADKKDQHLILLSATPHSGKPDQFKSILGLLDKKFLSIDLSNSTQSEREDLAKYYVQRRREDIKSWMGKNVKQTTSFPNRESFEIDYLLDNDYLEIQQDIMKLANKLVANKSGHKARFSYWTALGLVRGVMSSPLAGLSMIEKRGHRDDIEEDTIEDTIESINPVIEDDFNLNDDNEILYNDVINDSEVAILKSVKDKLTKIYHATSDQKTKALQNLIVKWDEEGFYPIIYCRYIKTADYLHTTLQKEIGSIIRVEKITSEDPEEVRKQKIDELKAEAKKILIATDCMSEGINLQECFNAVVHFDLPWNPNRLEQREGRVDRFGQVSPIVKTALMYGKNNPMDGVVLNVLLKKAREIKKAIGISVPFPENNQSIMETVTKAILLKHADNYEPNQQLSLFTDEEILAASGTIDQAYKKIEDIEKVSRSIFTQHSIKANDIDKDLDEAIRLIGDISSVEHFVLSAMKRIGGQMTKTNKGYKLRREGLPLSFINFFPQKRNDRKDREVELLLSFATPTPQGYKYVSRNHDIVDHLCQTLIADAFYKEVSADTGVYRVGAIETDRVTEPTTLLLLRARNVIESIATKHQIVAEELMLWGYENDPADKVWIDEERCLDLIQAMPTGELSRQDKKQLLDIAIEDVSTHRELINDIARSRAEKLVEAHDRFRIAVKGKQYQVVEPILPMDVIGVYILIPQL